MNISRTVILLLFSLLSLAAIAQPEPCGQSATMTSFCSEACVICDINGFSGINDLTAQGQGVDGFCTTQYNNMQFIAFIAGSVDLTIRVDVGNCTNSGWGGGSLEVGFFYSDDCENFSPITACDTDIESNQSQTFTNIVPLIVGQHYYMVIDGSAGSNCDWVFNVIDGSTEVLSLDESGTIIQPDETCPNQPTTFSTTDVEGAAIFYWTIDGELQSETRQETQLTFEESGEYTVCVTAANACDQAEPSCTTIKVREVGDTSITKILCDGECLEANGVEFCETGSFVEVFKYPSGCDSLIFIDIEVLDQPQTTVDLWICSDQEYLIGNDAYNTTGMYTGTVLTENDCDSLVFLDLLVIECEIIGIPDQIPVVCKGTATGTLLFSVNQGEPPLTYTYTNVENINFTGTGTTNLLVDNQINDIPVGLYQIHIEDDFGNDVVILQEVTEPPLLEINLVPSTYGDYNVSCFEDTGDGDEDGTLTAELEGGVPPYSYEWSNGQDSQTSDGLTHDIYTVTVTDAAGCSIEDSYEMTSPSLVNNNIVFNDPTCEGFETGTIEILPFAGGIPPYQYALNGGSFNTNTMYDMLTEGEYTVSYIDSNNCEGVILATIVAPQIPVINFDQALSVLLGDSTQIIPMLNNVDIQSISWSESTTLNCSDCLEPYARPVNDTQYTLTVTSEDDCSASAPITINVKKRRRVYVPNIFTPNQNDVNDLLVVNAGLEVESVSNFNIYDRWGGLVYSESNFPPNDRAFGWDGRFDSKDINPGVYVWSADILFIDGVTLKYTGTVTLAE